LIIEHLARVAQAADMDAGLFEIFIPARQAVLRRIGFVSVVVVPPCDSADQIEHVKFGRGMMDQMGEVAEALGVLQTEGFPAIADSPVLAIFAEDPLLRSTDFWRWLAD
jgi:hypothetical protein